MIFNLISKNNGVNGAVIKNNGTEVFTPVVGTIYSCTKDLLPKSAGINDFYYVQEDNSLLVGQGAGKPLKEITGVIISDSAGVNLNDYVTKDALANNLDTVTNNIKALIPDITEYMKSVDIQAALNTKADASNVYSKTEVDALIDAIKAGTADLDLYLTKADADNTYALKNHTHDMSSYLTAADIADFTTNSDVDNKIAAAVSGVGSGDLTKADADTYYASIGHNHDSQYYKKSETMSSSDISDAIASAITGVSANSLTKDQAALLYAPIDHKHSDVYTKVETNTQISAAIAAAGLAGNKDVDLSAYLTVTDADATYLKKTDAVTTAAVQTMIDNSGHLTNADIVGFLDKDTADTLYQPVGTYLDKATADTLYQPIGTSASGGLDAKTVQSMIDNAGHLTAADVATMQADINAAKADASAAKATATQAAQDAQDAKTKAESVETIANDAKTKAEAAETKADAAKATAETAKTTAEAAQSAADTAKSIAEGAQAKADANETNINNINANITTLQTNVQTAQSTADAAKTQAETNAATFADYVKTADLKGLVDQYIKEYLATSGSGSSGGDSGGNSGGDASGGTFSYGSLTPGVITTLNIPAGGDGNISLTDFGCKLTEDVVMAGKVHFYVMPGTTAVGDYVAKHYPEGLPIPISVDGPTDETRAYDQIWKDHDLEYPGWVSGFDTSTHDDADETFDIVCMTGYTILAGWVFGIMIDPMD